MKKLKSDSGSTKRFGYEWQKYNRIIPEYEEQFLKWISPLKKLDFKGKRVLDAGCGIGRNSFWPLKYGAKEIVCFDYDERTVAAAKRNLMPFKNVHVYYGSIYDIPYKNKFDISFSIGVIHHLENPRAAVAELIKSTKRGGKVLIWVYGYEGNEWIVKCVNPIRSITSRLPLRVVHLLSHWLAIPLYAYVKLLEPRSAYLKQLSRFNFWHIKSIVFDQLIPKIANYWRKEEALSLLKSQNLKDVKAVNVNNNSWAVSGTKR